MRISDEIYEMAWDAIVERTSQILLEDLDIASEQYIKIMKEVREIDK